MQINKFTEKIISEKMTQEAKLLKIETIKMFDRISKKDSFGYKIAIKYENSEIYAKYFFGKGVSWGVDTIVQNINDSIEDFQSFCYLKFNEQQVDYIVEAIKIKYEEHINQLTKNHGMSMWDERKLAGSVKIVSKKYKYAKNPIKMYDKCLSDSFALREIKMILKGI